MIFSIIGSTLICLGTLVSLLFWIPKLVNRPRLKEMLGSRYPMIWIIYAANGPGLVLLGLLLVLLF